MTSNNHYFKPVLSIYYLEKVSLISDYSKFNIHFLRRDKLLFIPIDHFIAKRDLQIYEVCIGIFQ